MTPYSDDSFNNDDEFNEHLLYTQLYYGSLEHDNHSNNENEFEKEVQNIDSPCSTSNGGQLLNKLENSPSPNNNIDKNEKLFATSSQRLRNISVSSVESISGKLPLDELYCRDDNFDDLSTIEEEKENLSSSSSVDNDVVCIPFEQKDGRNGIEDLYSSSSDNDNDSVVFMGNKKTVIQPKNPLISSDSSDESTAEIMKSPSSVPLSYLSSLDKKSILKHKKSIFRKTGGAQSRVNYSEFRPLLIRKSSCPMYTPEMSALYDSYKSGDFSIKDLHNFRDRSTIEEEKKDVSYVCISDDDDVVYSPPGQKYRRNDIVDLYSSSSDDDSVIFMGNKKKTIIQPKNPLMSSDSSDDSTADIMNSPPSVPLSFNISSLKKKSILKHKRCVSRKMEGFQSRVIYSKFRPLSNRKPSCSVYTPEMSALYDSDESGDFSVEGLHAIQTDDASAWKIRREDCPHFVSRYFNKEPRCPRCRQFGHTVKDCLKVPVCPYCGSPEHTKYFQCPTNCCLRCGDRPHGYCKKTAIYVTCSECGCKGHIASLCPNQWRQFYNTIQGNDPILPQHTEKVKHSPFCCNCGKKGHYGYQCRDSVPSGYVITPMLIKNFESPYSPSKFRSYVNSSMEFEEDNELRTPIKFNQWNKLKLPSFKNLLYNETGCHIEYDKVLKNLCIRGPKSQCINAKKWIKAVNSNGSSKGTKNLFEIYKKNKMDMEQIHVTEKLNKFTYQNLKDSHKGVLPLVESFSGCRVEIKPPRNSTTSLVKYHGSSEEGIQKAQNLFGLLKKGKIARLKILHQYNYKLNKTNNNNNKKVGKNGKSQNKWKNSNNEAFPILKKLNKSKLITNK